MWILRLKAVVSGERPLRQGTVLITSLMLIGPVFSTFPSII